MAPDFLFDGSKRLVYENRNCLPPLPLTAQASAKPLPSPRTSSTFLPSSRRKSKAEQDWNGRILSGLPLGYIKTNDKTRDGQLVSDLPREESQRPIDIITPNETLTLPRDEIQSMRQTDLSLMPEGLLQGMPDGDVLDLFAYLRSPAQVPNLQK